jgi:hypothetical protein
MSKKTEFQQTLKVNEDWTNFIDDFKKKLDKLRSSVRDSENETIINLRNYED